MIFSNGWNGYCSSYKYYFFWSNNKLSHAITLSYGSDVEGPITSSHLYFPESDKGKPNRCVNIVADETDKIHYKGLYEWNGRKLIEADFIQIKAFPIYILLLKYLASIVFFKNSCHCYVLSMSIDNL